MIEKEMSIPRRSLVSASTITGLQRLAWGEYERELWNISE